MRVKSSITCLVFLWKSVGSVVLNLCSSAYTWICLELEGYTKWELSGVLRKKYWKVSQNLWKTSSNTHIFWAGCVYSILYKIYKSVVVLDLWSLNYSACISLSYKCSQRQSVLRYSYVHCWIRVYCSNCLYMSMSTIYTAKLHWECIKYMNQTLAWRLWNVAVLILKELALLDSPIWLRGATKIVKR
jgi:hypothetical protein